QRIGIGGDRLGKFPRAVARHKQEGAHHAFGLLYMSPMRRQVATTSPCWFRQVCSNSTMPALGRDALSRLLRTFVIDRSVSPAKTGFGNFTSLMPRFPIVVPIVVSCTDMPIIMASV